MGGGWQSNCLLSGTRGQGTWKETCQVLDPHHAEHCSQHTKEPPIRKDAEPARARGRWTSGIWIPALSCGCPRNLPNLIAPTLWQLSDYGGGITSQSWRLLLYKTPRVVPNAHGSVGFEGALLFELLMVPTQLCLLWVRAFTSCHGLPSADGRKACCCSNTRVNAALKRKIEIIDIEALMEANPGVLSSSNS